MKTIQNYINESSLARIYQHLTSDREVGTITAFRGDLPLRENEQRNRKLSTQVRRAGYGHIWVDGAWIENEGEDDELEVSEVSLFIVGQEGQNSLFDYLVSWSQEYNQDGFIYKPSGQSTSINLYDKRGSLIESFKTTQFDRISQVYTRLRNGSHAGRSFYFESCRPATSYYSQLLNRKK